MRRLSERTREYRSALAILGALVSACVGPHTATPNSGPLRAPDLPALQGQAVTCAGSPQKSFAREARGTHSAHGMGFRLNAWTYNGLLPGPVIEACEGDRVRITLTNHGGTSHGLDSHALEGDMMHFGPVAPGLLIVATVWSLNALADALRRSDARPPEARP